MEGLTLLLPSSSETPISKGSVRSLELDYARHWQDFSVFGSVFLLSLLIAVFYGIFGRNKDSAEEFLMGGRTMSIFPVAMSLCSSYVSTVAILGIPQEIYFYGSQCLLILVCFVPLTIVMVYIYIPIYFNMELSSPFEYFERRFSRSVRIFVSTLSLAQMMVYMTLVVYFTSSSLSSVTGVNNKVMGAVIFIISIFSSSMGGFQGMMWTATLQALVLIGSLTSAVVMGLLEVKDFGILWENVRNGRRFELLNFDPDPRSRHTVWTSVIGGYFIWISIFAGTQTQIQRLLSLSNVQRAKKAIFLHRAFVLNICGVTVLLALCFMAGILIFAKYYDCDPLEANKIPSHTELFTYFVTNLFRSHPGLLGLFLAAIACSCLSVVGNSLNSMVSLVAYDFLKYWIPNVSDYSLIFLSKVLNVVFGGISFSLVVVADNAEQILTAAWSISGMVIGPIFGLYTLGMFFPWANSKGSLLALFTTLLLCIFGLILSDAGVKDGLIPSQRLPLPDFGCESSTLNVSSSASTSVQEYQLEVNTGQNVSLSGISASFLMLESHAHGTDLLEIVSMSYMWYPALGSVLTLLLGLLFSLTCMKFTEKLSSSPECFSPSVLSLWVKWFPSHMAIWVEPDDNLFLLSSSAFSFLPRTQERYQLKAEPRCDVEIKTIYKEQETL